MRHNNELHLANCERNPGYESCADAGTVGACILYFIHPDLEPLLCRTVGSIRVQETDLLTKTFESVLYTLYSLLPLLHLYGLL